MTGDRPVVIRDGRLLDAPAHRADGADILVDGGRIREIGPPGMAAPADARPIDASDRLLMPGLVNAHTHGHGSFAKGSGDRWTLELLLNAGPWISGNRSLEDKYTAAFLNAAEMVRKGCTACYDLYFEFPAPSAEGMEAVGRAYAEVGVRATLAPMMADRSLYQAIPGLMDALPDDVRAQIGSTSLAARKDSLAACRTMLESWPFDRDRVRPALAPTIPHHCSDDFWRAAADLAREHGVGLHTHLAESKIQAQTGIARYGKTLTAHLDDLGVLGPDFTGAHAIWLDDDDIRRLADNGCAAAHNPGSNLRLGSGIAPVRAMLDAGMTVGIGTDGSSSADNQNMFEAMRMASFVARITTPDYTRWPETHEVIAMATEGGARLMGFAGEIGRIEPGYMADIVFLDLANLSFVPLNDAANQIVNCEDSSAVASVMIGGRMVLDQGRFTGFDEAKLRSDVEAAVERLRAVNADARGLAEALEAHVGAFCVGLAARDYHIDRLCGCA